MMFLILAFRASSMTFFSRIVWQNAGVRVLDEAVQLGFEAADILNREIVEVAVGAGEDDQNLLFDRQRLILVLLQNLDQAAAAVELLLRGLVEVGAELREGRQFAVLREFETERTGNRSHGLGLRAAADAADRETDVDGRPDVRVEQVGFEVDLTVGDRNHVGRNVRRNVARLRFDERQRGERTAAVRVVQLGGALQQAAVQIEHVAGERLAAWRTAEQQRDLAIRRGVLRKIVVDDKRVAACCRGSTRPWRSRRTGRCTASARDPRPWQRRRWCNPSRRSRVSVLTTCATVERFWPMAT